MIVKINKKERLAMQYACSLADLKVGFFTIEKNDLIIQAEILTDKGDDPSLVMVWDLARMMESKIQCDEFINRK